MFVIYAVPVGLVAGLLLGGSLDGLAAVRFRSAGVALAGLVAQIVLFSGAVDGLVGAAAPALYVASTVAVLAAVVRNLAIAGLPIVALGALSNLSAIVANGGYMPADPAALRAAGFSGDGAGFSNSVANAAPALRPLTDIFAIPAGWPLANVFSVGDVLIGVGIAVAIAVAMRRRSPGPAAGVTLAQPPVRASNSPD